MSEILVLCNFDLDGSDYCWRKKPYLFSLKTDRYIDKESEYAIVRNNDGKESLARVLEMIDLSDVYQGERENVKSAMMIATGAKEPLAKVVKFFVPRNVYEGEEE